MTSRAPASSQSPIILLLAAGQSRRFGVQKLLQPLNDGRAMVLQSLELALSLQLPVTVVTDAAQPELVGLLQGQGGDVLALPEADQGLGSNLARAVAARPSHAGWLVMLADMPWIAPGTLQMVMANTSETSITVPVFQGQRGHPVWFGSAYREELVRLSGDQGGKRILQACPAQVVEVEVTDAAIHWDVDTPEDLQRLPAAHRNIDA